MPEDDLSTNIILDHLVPTKVSEDIGFNEIITLHSLKMGLNLIAVTVWQTEESLRREDEAANQRSMHFGHHPSTDRRQAYLLPCYFHWFGVSVCNYVRLVGFLTALKNGTITRQNLENNAGKKRVAGVCSGYVKEVTEISEVLVWRNKVAAHFAITDPREDDNVVTLDMSVMHPVSYSVGRYRVGEVTIARSSGDGVPIESQIPTWSLTEVYERLAPRYWPSFRWPQAETSAASTV